MDNSRVAKCEPEDPKELEVRRCLVGDARCTGPEGPEQREILLSRGRYLVRLDRVSHRAPLGDPVCPETEFAAGRDGWMRREDLLGPDEGSSAGSVLTSHIPRR